MKLLIAVSVLLLSAQSQGQPPDAACMTACQEPLVALQPANAGASISPSEAANHQKKVCEVYGELKTCMLACNGGAQAWDIIKNSVGGLVSGCGQDGGSGDANSDQFPDMLCGQNCQLKFSEEVSKFLPQGPPQPGTGPDPADKNVTELLEQNDKLCEASETMKACVLGCKGGKKLWEDNFDQGPNPFCKTQSCPVKCQYEASLAAGWTPPPEGAQVSPTDMAKFHQKSCEVYGYMKTCILACDDGEKYWKEFTNSTTTPGEPSILAVCGLGEGTGDSTSPDFQDWACAQTCQLQSSKEFSQLLPSDSSSSTGSPDVAGILAKQKEICDANIKMKNCILSCSGGAQVWESFAGGDTIKQFIQQCESGTGVSGIGDPFGNGSPAEAQCALECQQASQSKIGGAIGGADPTSIEEMSSRTKEMCDAINVLKTCLLNCGQAGQAIWKTAFEDGLMSNPEMKPFIAVCFPGSEIVKPQEEILEDHQCFVGACAKCTDLPNGSCFPDFNVYPTKTACVDSGCGSKGKDIAGNDIPKYDYCKQDGSLLGVSNINLQCNPKVLAAGCAPGLSCVPLEAFGATYCCLDTPEQAQSICLQKCDAVPKSQQSAILSVISQPDAFQKQTCRLYNINKECVLKCPMGEAGWTKYEEKELENGEGIYKSIIENCGSSATKTVPNPVKITAETSETNPEVAEYCRRVLNQKKGDTAFCNYQNFKETCKNVCPQ